MEIGDTHGLFQSVHGSAPDIAGKGIVNPIAAILSGGLLFEWLGRRNNDLQATAVGNCIHKAVEVVLARGLVRTPDLGGSNKTEQVGDAIAKEIEERF